ncbi:DUF2958 domain-containing protein [Sphingobium ummariense]|uniref:Uncharacterized protein n=1 Tax=Sphingobium ummariense RL-3 TaxID=1346791 RepID=T0IUN2_9SPHN|nr:DUF2958 domain-containing protein [Sphingobium ummariense]EQB32550.1 hypothetical protein M529_08960 [Sphingobium ummariense RL-3]
MEWLSVFAPEAAQRLAENHKEQLPLKGTSRERDFEPVCKLFLPWTAGTWLLTELDDDGLAFGLCDIGHGMPEVGYVSMDEIYAVKGPGGLRVEQDLQWRAKHTLSEYAAQARSAGYIRA